MLVALENTFLKFEIFVSCSDVIKPKFGQKDSNPYFVSQRLQKAYKSTVSHCITK